MKGYRSEIAEFVKEGKQQKFDPAFLQKRKQGLDTFMRNIEKQYRGALHGELYVILCFLTYTRSAVAIFDAPNGSAFLARWLAPGQLGDIKPPGFVLPLAI